MRTAGSQNKTTPLRRKALLEGALALFVKQGFEQTSMDEICDRVGVTKGSAYHHFLSKEAIAAALYREAIVALHEVVRAALASTTRPQAGIEGLVRAYLQWFAQHATWGAFVFRVMDGHLLEEHVAEVWKAQRRFETQTAEWLAPSMAQGAVATLSPTLVVALVIGPARDFLRRWLPTARRAEMSRALEVLPRAAWVAVKATARA